MNSDVYTENKKSTSSSDREKEICALAEHNLTSMGAFSSGLAKGKETEQFLSPAAMVTSRSSHSLKKKVQEGGEDLKAKAKRLMLGQTRTGKSRSSGMEPLKVEPISVDSPPLAKSKSPKSSKGKAPVGSGYVDCVVEHFNQFITNESASHAISSTAALSLDRSATLACLSALSAVNCRIQALAVLKESVQLMKSLSQVRDENQSLKDKLDAVKKDLKEEKEKNVDLSDNFASLESMVADLTMAGYELAQEEVMKLYPTLDLSRMSYPPL